MIDVEEYLMENPKYVKLVKRLIEYEENNINPDHAYIDDDDYDSCWESADVKVKPQTLYQLEMNGVLDRVFDTNSTTAYSLSDRDALKDIIDNASINDDGTAVEMHDFPEDEDELPDDLFDDVVGYEDVKWLIKRGLTTQEITNFLVVGPTGSAKTVFLMSIEEKLSNAEFVSGNPTTGAGVLDVMFKRTPKYMLIDEMDDMDADTQKVLTQYTETGIVDETKVGKDRKLKTNTKTFASANSTDPIIDQMEDRFLDLHFEPYTKDEYIEVCTHILPDKEDATEDEAKIIAELLWESEGEGDVRKAIQVARLSRGDPERVIDVLDDYSPKRGVLSV